MYTLKALFLALLLLPNSVYGQDKNLSGEIVDLISEGKVEIRSQGGGISSVRLEMKRLVPYTLKVKIPVGSFFVSANSSSQNMVSTATEEIVLNNDQWKPIFIPAACANRPLNIPGESDSFTIQRSPRSKELEKLMPVLDRSGADYATRQAAVWIITDDATYDDLGILQVSGRYQSYSYRAIGCFETGQAIKICSDAGIDIYSKKIWYDREEVLRGITDAKLRASILGLSDKQEQLLAKVKAKISPEKIKVQTSITWKEVVAGAFEMGKQSKNGEITSGNDTYQVFLSAYRISFYPVTFEQYDLFCEATGAEKPLETGNGRGKNPVVNISWTEASAFASWAGCRLPTEAEWEQACRLDKISVIGPDDLSNLSSSNRKNQISMNEWCNDWFGPYPSSLQDNPRGPSTGTKKVIRGEMNEDGSSDSCSHRLSSPHETKSGNTGFRLVISK